MSVISKKHLSTYEVSCIVHFRTVMLSSGKGTPLVEFKPDMSPIEIANKELEEGKLDFLIRRKFPSDYVEDCETKKMILPQ